jgi:hypothetical protein
MRFFMIGGYPQLSTRCEIAEASRPPGRGSRRDGGGRPVTDSCGAASFTMLSMRVGVSVDYAITRNAIATLALVSIELALVPDPLFINSLVQFEARM